MPKHQNNDEGFEMRPSEKAEMAIAQATRQRAIEYYKSRRARNEDPRDEHLEEEIADAFRAELLDFATHPSLRNYTSETQRKAIQDLVDGNLRLEMYPGSFIEFRDRFARIVDDYSLNSDIKRADALYERLTGVKINRDF